MTRKVFYKLLGAFSLLLVFHAVVMGAIFHQVVEYSAVSTLPVLGREALLSGVAAFICLSE